MNRTFSEWSVGQPRAPPPSLQELVSLGTEPARQLVANKDFALLLRVVLEVGNHMNIGTARCGVDVREGGR